VTIAMDLEDADGVIVCTARSQMIERGPGHEGQSDGLGRAGASRARPRRHARRRQGVRRRRRRPEPAPSRTTRSPVPLGSQGSSPTGCSPWATWLRRSWHGRVSRCRARHLRPVPGAGVHGRDDRCGRACAEHRGPTRDRRARDLGRGRAGTAVRNGP
jgi:hypothetical protein